MPNLLNLDMTNNVLSVASVQKIKNAWGHRGLLLDDGVLFLEKIILKCFELVKELGFG